MTCPEWEARIALAVEGDTPAGAVEAHLAVCPRCREFAEGLRASRAAFKELRDEAVDDAVLDAIRSRAMAAIAAAPPSRRVRWWWLLPPAAAAAAAAAILLMGMVRVPEPPRPVYVAHASACCIDTRVDGAPRRDESRRSTQECVRHVPQTARAAAPHEALLMKIVTDDPNVVIYWIVEDKQKGD